MSYISTKTYGHDLGLSVCFRQWRAESHCKYLHGYALAIRLEFEADELDTHNWVVDFGGLKTFKEWLQATFDHKMLVAEDDPERIRFMRMEAYGMAQPVVVPNTGCEAFAEYIHRTANTWLDNNGYKPRVRLRSVEVCEHGANSAIYTGPRP